MRTGFKSDMTGHTCQDLSTGGMGMRHHVKIMETAVPHDQHAGANRAQEAKTTDAFTGVTRPEASIHHGMGATLDQIDPLHLRKSTVAAVTMMPAKDRHIGRGIGDIFHGAVNRHQAQPKEKGARRRLRGQRLTNLMKQRHQRSCTQLIPAIAQGAGASHVILRIRPDVAQALARFTHGLTHATRCYRSA